MRNHGPVREVLKKLETCPIARHTAIRVLYLNSAKVDSLFDTTFRGVSRIVDATTRTDEAELEAAGEGGVSSGIIGFFLNLKASLATRLRKGEAREAIIKSEVTGVWRMALAEIVLQEQGLVSDQPTDCSKPYLRLTNVLRPFSPQVELADLTNFLRNETAEVVMKRLKNDDKIHPGVTQFVYAADTPVPIACVLVAPPNPDYGVQGTSDACYPGGGAWNRVLFGTPSEWNGVTFVDPYYVIDMHLGGNEAA